MDQLLLRVWHVQKAVAIGRHLAKAQVDGQDRVGLVDQRLDMGLHAHACLTRISCRMVVELVLKAKGGDHRDVRSFGEILQGAAAFGLPVAPTDQQKRPCRAGKKRARRIHRCPVWRGLGDGDGAGQGPG